MSETSVKKAVVLLSGGVDSATMMAEALQEGFEVYALTIDYAQRHRVEISAARAVARSLGAARHLVFRLEDLGSIGGSSLTGDGEVPKGRGAEEMGSGVPATYVPARNTVFLSLALAWAEVVGARCVFIGVNAVDYSGYPDCRPEYIDAFQKMADVATRCAVEGDPIEIMAPLVEMSKAQIIKLGAGLGVDFGLTCSCYDPDESGAACGECDSCTLRRNGFTEAGIEDPTRYR
ncbi:MAG: 7-cyano-7-deazaguanine synthase QueC [Actinobacteria bacterium]|nr:7-cyano-7-deazaguanine synthase QueC [Actinomycetota bacterium]MCG2818464.1 7-cyano-7-deazaguanine synthase QueC [Actinomycetes bacterium]MBU4218579.1 7-cyano-7-deazaguanine synthase QueC [Actinomycetota bacterium]MBU4391591.1 7-cyano-7-deazaguanine synthase QueC [Actinomycetota bacterium]MBU4401324.1 7-cyano-7-deazaguanine synthase QueC [Actinomycetota bacterium]